MNVLGLELADVIRQLEREGYFMDELHKDSDGDDVLDVYPEEGSPRVLEMTFDDDSEECIGYAFVQSEFANNYVKHITEILEALNA